MENKKINWSKAEKEEDRAILAFLCFVSEKYGDEYSTHREKLEKNFKDILISISLRKLYEAKLIDAHKKDGEWKFIINKNGIKQVECDSK